MEYSINSSHFRKIRGTEETRSDFEAAMICKAGGFDILDCSPALLTNEDFEKLAYELSDSFMKEGIRVEQGHAPYNRYAKLPLEEYKTRLWRSLKIANILGTKYLVVHSDESIPGMEIYSEKAADFMYDMFMPYVEYAAKNGVGIAIENLSDTPIEFFVELVDRFNTDTVSVCWDFGHANCAYGKNALNNLKMIGNRLSCTHVHDNKGDMDSHLPMYFGTTKWEEAAKYLKENYNGVFTYEFVYDSIPTEFLVEYLALAKKTAERLFEKA